MNDLVSSRARRFNPYWLIGYIAGREPEAFARVLDELGGPAGDDLPEWAYADEPVLP